MFALALTMAKIREAVAINVIEDAPGKYQAEAMRKLSEDTVLLLESLYLCSGLLGSNTVQNHVISINGRPT